MKTSLGNLRNAIRRSLCEGPTVIRACRSGAKPVPSSARGASLGPGYYFTTNPVTARKYADFLGCIIWVDVTLNNPLVGNKHELAQQMGLDFHRDDDSGAYDYVVGGKLGTMAREMGHDGIVARGIDGKHDEIVVFDASGFTVVGEPECERKL